MNEVVKYHNDMNTVNFNGFNAVELDLLLSICAKVRDEGTKSISYDFIQLRELSKYKPTANQRFVDDLQRVNRKLLSLNFTIKTPTTITQFVLFKTFKIHLDTQILEISVNEEFSYILNELTANFMRFELNEFVSLESKYAKNLYRLLKQYRSTGKAYFTLEEFKNKLDIPKSYAMSDIDKKVIDPIKTELTPLFSGLKIEKVKNLKKRGHPVTNINFYFSAEKSLKSAENAELERMRKIYLPDFTLADVNLLLRHGSLEQLKQAGKKYDNYKQDSSIRNKMGFMVSLLQDMAPKEKSGRQTSFGEMTRNLFDEF